MIGVIILVLFFLFLYYLILRHLFELIRRFNSVSIFDGFFIAGLFFTVIPSFYSLFVEEISILNILIFNPYKDLGLLCYILFSNLLFGLCAIIFSARSYNNQFDLSAFEVRFFSGLLVLYFVSLCYIFISSGKLEGDAHWYRSNADFYSGGFFNVLLGQFHNVGRVVIPGLCMYFQFKYLSKGKVFKNHFYVIGLLVPMELIFSGNRIAILFFLFSLFIPFLIYGYYRKIFMFILICFPLVIIAKIWPIVRGLLWTEQVSISRVSDILQSAYLMEFVDAGSNGGADPILVLTEGSNLASLSDIWNSYPDNVDFTYGNTMVFKAFGTLIPRSLWKDKPDGLGHEVGEKVFPGISLYLNITILGDAWANFGWFGIFYIMFFLVLIQFFLLKTFKNNSTFFSSLFFMISVASWRFEFSFYFVSIYTIIIILILFKFKYIRFLLNRISLMLFVDYYKN